jgi:hypothetical protein
MSWYKIPLSADQIANNLESQIQDDFQKLFFAAHGPKDMALFASQLSIREPALYVSPGSLPIAEGLVRKHGGVPCEKPEKNDVALLVGNQSDIDRILA